MTDTGGSAKLAPAPAGGRKPVIFAVDDEPQVLNAVALDLRRRFRGDYRIMTAASGAEALDAVRKLRQRGDLVALFLVDQRMPAMTGTEFLTEARKIHPEAKKVLLTAYADTEAAIASINQVALDHYLMKPWHPPEQKLYPVVDELLDAWTQRRARPVGRHPRRGHAVVVGEPRGQGLPRAQPDPVPLARSRPRSGGARARGDRPRRCPQAAAAVLPRRRRAVGACAPGDRREGRPAHAGRRRSSTTWW